MRHPPGDRLQARHQGVGHAQGVAVVLVVGPVDAEIDVAGAAVEGDRGGVARVDLEAHDRGAAIERGHLGGLQEGPAEAAALLFGQDRHRIQPRERGPAVEQDQGIAHELAVLLGDQALGSVAGKKVAEAAAREAVVLEAPLLDLDQRLEILGDRGADQPARRGHGATALPPDVRQGGHGWGSAAGARGPLHGR